MNKIKSYNQRTILLDAIFYTLIIVGLHFILSIYKLRFMRWIYIVSSIIIMIGFICGVIQLLLKIKIKFVKNTLLSTFIVLLLLSAPIIYFCVRLTYTPEYIVEKDGKEYVAYVYGIFLRVNVRYYDYKNIFISGNQLRIYENYGEGAFDPIKNKRKYKNKIKSVTYYDENGKIIIQDK